VKHDTLILYDRERSVCALPEGDNPQAVNQRQYLVEQRKDGGAMVIWSKPAGTSGSDAPNYWEYFGSRFVKLAAVSPGLSVLDVGCGTGSSMFPATERVGPGGRVIGIDICEH
jgi:SAM-dependent methyltransferase